MLKEIKTEEKISILISALEERYKSIHVIRDRVQNIGIWFLGIMFAIGGWVIQSNFILWPLQKLIFIFGIIILFLTIKCIYLNDLQKGFKGQQKIMVKIEESLGFFESNFFNASDKALYPIEWKKAGDEDCDGKFFETTFILLYIGTIFPILAIMLF